MTEGVGFGGGAGSIREPSRSGPATTITTTNVAATVDATPVVTRATTRRSRRRATWTISSYAGGIREWDSDRSWSKSGMTRLPLVLHELGHAGPGA